MGRLKVCWKHLLQLLVRRGVVREVRQEGELGTDSELGQKPLHIHHRLMARMRSLIAQGIDDEELRTTDLRPFLRLDGLHICDVAHRTNAVAHDRQRPVHQGNRRDALTEELEGCILPLFYRAETEACRAWVGVLTEDIVHTCTH